MAWRTTRGQNQKKLPHPCLLGGQKRVKLLSNPCVLGDPQTRGHNQKCLPNPCLLGGPKRGQQADPGVFPGQPN